MSGGAGGLEGQRMSGGRSYGGVQRAIIRGGECPEGACTGREYLEGDHTRRGMPVG